MLFKQHLWGGIADGTVTVAFRRWKRPTVKTGGTLRTPAGMIAFDAVEPIEESEITTEDARRAGFEDRAEVLAALRYGEDRRLYRVRFHRTGPDPRIELRDRSELSAAELAEVVARLDRLDTSSTDLAWTRSTLALIAAHPGRVARDLAAELGSEVVPFKRRVRSLKELGLTESLPVGYRLSPRGQVVWDHVAGPPGSRLEDGEVQGREPSEGEHPR